MAIECIVPGMILADVDMSMFPSLVPQDSHDHMKYYEYEV